METLNTLLERGVVLHRNGDFTAAEALYRQALARDRDHPDALHLLGLVARQTGRLGQARQLIKRALKQQPDFPEAHYHLGDVQRDSGDLEQAIQSYRRAIALKPDFSDAYNNLGNAYLSQRKYAEAAAAYRHATEISPNTAAAHANLGIALKALGQMDEALSAYQQALQVDPNYWQAALNLGNTRAEQGAYGVALEHYRQALIRAPETAEIYKGLASALLRQGRVEEAIANYERALRFEPTNPARGSNLLFAMNYSAAHSNREIFEAHRAWGQKWEEIAPIVTSGFKNVPDAKRKIRVGYISPDFRHHPVGRLFEPVLSAHDRQKFDVVCYANVESQDALTLRLQGAAGAWRDIVGKPVDEVAKMVVRDRIDILVDLAGHTGNNSLGVFMRKPAPVQVSWLGYYNTTGLSAMDYLISDEYASPRDDEQPFIEQLVRLPYSRFCYAPPQEAPAVSPPPCLSNHGVTFACFNNLAKVNEAVISLWAALLRRMPDSRLILKTRALSDPETWTRYLTMFKQHGVEEARIETRGASSYFDMLREYGDVDIALDPFPFTGGMTTLEALWMGVPVITLKGHAMVARQSASFLALLELPQWIADSPEAYLEIAQERARERVALSVLRQGMRERMLASSLCDATGFTLRLEDAYRAVWRTWCASHSCRERNAND